jgi:preprotein translocase subunit SecY
VFRTIVQTGAIAFSYSSQIQINISSIRFHQKSPHQPVKLNEKGDAPFLTRAIAYTHINRLSWLSLEVAWVPTGNAHDCS